MLYKKCVREIGGFVLENEPTEEVFWRGVYEKVGAVGSSQSPEQRPEFS